MQKKKGSALILEGTAYVDLPIPLLFPANTANVRAVRFSGAPQTQRSFLEWTRA